MIPQCFFGQADHSINVDKTETSCLSLFPFPQNVQRFPFPDGQLSFGTLANNTVHITVYANTVYFTVILRWNTMYTTVILLGILLHFELIIITTVFNRIHGNKVIPAFVAFRIAKKCLKQPLGMTSIFVFSFVVK